MVTTHESNIKLGPAALAWPVTISLLLEGTYSFTYVASSQAHSGAVPRNATKLGMGPIMRMIDCIETITCSWGIA